MNDRSHITHILAQATKYDMLHEVFMRDQALTPRTVEVMRDIFLMGLGRNSANPNERRQYRRR